MKTLQFFISSPGDVFEERAIANRVIERLQSEYIGKIVLEPVLWEHEPLVATSTFQHQIVKPSETDVVLAILWSRLGTKLPNCLSNERLLSVHSVVPQVAIQASWYNHALPCHLSKSASRTLSECSRRGPQDGVLRFNQDPIRSGE